MEKKESSPVQQEQEQESKSDTQYYGPPKTEEQFVAMVKD